MIVTGEIPATISKIEVSPSQRSLKISTIVSSFSRSCEEFEIFISTISQQVRANIFFSFTTAVAIRSTGNFVLVPFRDSVPLFCEVSEFFDNGWEKSYVGHCSTTWRWKFPLDLNKRLFAKPCEHSSTRPKEIL